MIDPHALSAVNSLPSSTQRDSALSVAPRKRITLTTAIVVLVLMLFAAIPLAFGRAEPLFACFATLTGISLVYFLCDRSGLPATIRWAMPGISALALIIWMTILSERFDHIANPQRYVDMPVGSPQSRGATPYQMSIQQEPHAITREHP
jgi:hypothetical protein